MIPAAVRRWLRQKGLLKMVQNVTLRTSFLLALSLLCLVCGRTLRGDEPMTGGAADEPNWIRSRLQDASDSIVTITVEGRDGRQAGLGTGFVVDGQGLIATNFHVIGEARPIEVRFADGRELPVIEIYASDRMLDLAVIRVAAEQLKPLKLATNEPPLQQGDAVLALGNPMGLRHSVVSGIVSGTRDIEGRKMIQIAIPIEPGNSGGPLLDRQGVVRGIVTMKSAVTANLGFALEASALQQLLKHPNPVAMTRWKTIGALNSQDWEPIFGARWQQRAGRILVSEPGDSFGGRSLCLWQRALPAEPFEVGAFVQLADEAGAAGLVFHADGKDRHYGFYPSAGRLRFTYFDGPTVYSWQILEEWTSPHYRPGQWNHLKVRLDGQQVECFVNDQSVLKRRLETSVTGRVGLAKFRDTEASFRQFRVAATLPPSQVEAARLASLREQIEKLPLGEWVIHDNTMSLTDDAQALRSALEQRSRELQEQAKRLDQLALDVHTREVIRQMTSLLAQPAEQLDLARAALVVSLLDNPDLDPEAYLSMLDRMADEVRALLAADASPTDRLLALDRYLFQEGGFHGSRTNYYHAANSYLDRVLDDREGLPVTLSVLYISLARRLGVAVDGVGLPGHFVTRFQPPDGDPVWIDPFDGGKRLSTHEVNQFLQLDSENSTGDDPLQAMAPRAMVSRILRNLQGIAQQNEDREAMLRYLEMLIALDPDDASSRGMRAMVRHETGRKQAAVEDLDWFLQHQPEGINPAMIEQLRTRFLEGKPTP